MWQPVTTGIKDALREVVVVTHRLRVQHRYVEREGINIF